MKYFSFLQVFRLFLLCFREKRLILPMNGFIDIRIVSFNNMSILDKIPSLAENELFQKLAAIEDITALCKEDQEKYDDAIKVMRDHIAAYKGAIIEAKIEVAKNMLMENEPIDKIARYTGLSEEELLRIKAKCSYTQGVTLG